MTTEDVVRMVIEALNKNDVAYMVVGSQATNFYCTPRSTQDADIIVDASSLVSVAKAIVKHAKELTLDPQLGFETVTGTKKVLLICDRHEFQIELFEIGQDPHNQFRFERRVAAELYEEPAWIATAEDSVITKIRWSLTPGREKDITDARNVIAVQNATLDWPYIEKWAREHESIDRLNELRCQIGLQDL